MKSSKTARVFLGLNAAFSLIIGVDLLIATDLASEILFNEESNWHLTALRVLGFGLLIFAIELFLLAFNRFITKKQVMVVTMLDVGWVVMSGLLLLAAHRVFTTTGETLIWIVAAFVAFFAAGQYVGAQNIQQPKSRVLVRSENGKLYATARRAVKAPVDKVWEIMIDHPGYADVASNLSKVEVLSGQGLGMERRCYGPKGESWRETCDLFEEEKVFGFNVHTEADDYPYPITDLKGRWSVKKDGSGSEFAIDIEAKPKGNMFMRALFVLISKRQFTGVLIDLADAWAERMERDAKT